MRPNAQALETLIKQWEWVFDEGAASPCVWPAGCSIGIAYPTAFREPFWL